MTFERRGADLRVGQVVASAALTRERAALAIAPRRKARGL
jgi:hypothetical protein